MQNSRGSWCGQQCIFDQSPKVAIIIFAVIEQPYYPLLNKMVIFFSPLRTAKRLLTEIVEKGRPAPAFHHNDGPGMTVQEIMVPASKAGLVIGKGGETIKSLQVSLKSK